VRSRLRLRERVRVWWYVKDDMVLSLQANVWKLSLRSSYTSSVAINECKAVTEGSGEDVLYSATMEDKAWQTFRVIHSPCISIFLHVSLA
jgi:hypothetical protein